MIAVVILVVLMIIMMEFKLGYRKKKSVTFVSL